MALPKKVRFLIVGAGVHGLSTAWHLARELRARRRGDGTDVLVVDKTGVAAGASGIACGVIRNFYYQPAMGEIMRVNLEVWESDPAAFHFNPVGYLAAVGEVQAPDVQSIYERQAATGFRSTFVRGESQVSDYMRRIFPDWRARGLTALIHEHQFGFAWNKESMRGLAQKAQAEGVNLLEGVEVTGFARRGDGSVGIVLTSGGPIEVEQVVIGAGPWIKRLWGMLDLPMKIDIKGRDGKIYKDNDMWTFWRLQEGEMKMDVRSYVTSDGKTPPVIHVDSSEPLISDRTGKLITDHLWGIYWKRDREGVQGGGVPEKIGPDAQVDPYGPASPYYTVGEDFADTWTAGLAHCLERFKGCNRLYDKAPSGGIGAFAADSFPVFDSMLPNVFVIADSNHGYKMIGVGREVARVLMGESSAVLRPFRFARFTEGDLHPVSRSPFPWS
ncbi:MAG: FAD-binding oxidoreductase [Planctomycetes bacterium]|nr:FAD-binding oxidoreductase [Planctomycetota bacterium]